MESRNIIKNNDLVKVKKIGNELELYNINTCNHNATIRRIKGYRHINLQTGEIVDENKTIFRGENAKNLLESNKRLFDLIKMNTIDLWKILMITLTYKEKTLNIDKIHEDYKSFIKKLRKNITEYGKIEYIAVKELYTDKLGYHIHAVLFFDESKEKVFIAQEKLEIIWGKGFTSVGQPINKNEISMYLTPHLANEVNDKNTKMHNKALCQMSLPSGANLYSYSKGIKRPEIWTDSYENTKQHLKENNYVLDKKFIYKNQMPTLHGNNLYYCKEIYKQITANDKPTLHRRKPI